MVKQIRLDPTTRGKEVFDLKPIILGGVQRSDSKRFVWFSAKFFAFPGDGLRDIVASRVQAGTDSQVFPA